MDVLQITFWHPHLHDRQNETSFHQIEWILPKHPEYLLQQILLSCALHQLSYWSILSSIHTKESGLGLAEVSNNCLWNRLVCDKDLERSTEYKKETGEDIQCSQDTEYMSVSEGGLPHLEVCFVVISQWHVASYYCWTSLILLIASVPRLIIIRFRFYYIVDCSFLPYARLQLLVDLEYLHHQEPSQESVRNHDLFPMIN